MTTKQFFIENEKTKSSINEMHFTQKMCQMLLQSPHYKKMGADGIFAIVEKARSIGISPTAALNGGMYYLKGKVEMSAAMMNQLIRKEKHSISKDRKSNDTICILHGKRADNGDTWTESFSIDDAITAGIYKDDGVWKKYPKDMLFARTLSRLARQLFPDVIHGCYVSGEISDAPPLYSNETSIETIPDKVSDAPPLYSKETTIKTIPDGISDIEADELDKLIGEDCILRKRSMDYIFREFGTETLADMPREAYKAIFTAAQKRFNERQSKTIDFALGEEKQLKMEA